MPDDISDISSVDDSDVDGDKTPEENEFLASFPDEEETIGEPKEKEGEKPSRPEIAQKIKYREKLLKAQNTIRDLQAKLEEKQAAKQPTEDEEREIRAQRYIRDQARKEYEAIIAEESAKKEAALEAFQGKLDDAVEESGYAEDDILDICEEFQVEPEVAVKILKRVEKQKSTKPKLPKPKGGESAVEEKPASEKDKGKSIYDIAADAKKTLRGMLRR